MGPSLRPGSRIKIALPFRFKKNGNWKTVTPSPQKTLSPLEYYHFIRPFAREKGATAYRPSSSLLPKENRLK
jgi:hypothetical protein